MKIVYLTLKALRINLSLSLTQTTQLGQSPQPRDTIRLTNNRSYMYVMLYTPNSVAVPVGDITYEGKWNKEDNAILWLIFLLCLSKTLLYVNERHTLNAAAELNSILLC